MRNERILVLGPSSAGKSTYIFHHLKNQKLQILRANQLDSTEVLNNNCIIHYNTFRPYKNSAKSLDNDLYNDPILKKIIQHKEGLSVHLLRLYVEYCG